MSGKARRLVVLGTALALGLTACSGDDEASPIAPSTAAAPTICPLTGEDIPADVDAARPAIAVKVENNPSVYPLSGLERAELVYEEVVEGGITRFMAFYHCTDAGKVGPVRSARVIDPAIMTPITRLLAAAGGNQIVRRELNKHDIVVIDEQNARRAMSRIPRSGIAFEHTLFGKTKALRKLGQRRFNDPPPEDLFEFGELEGGGRRARTITIKFSPAVTVTYRWRRGEWKRFDRGEPFEAESGRQVGVDNVLIEQHTTNFSRKIVDVQGNRSIEIKDATGSGRAVLFRDGRAIVGRWIRRSVEDPIRFVTRSGDDMVFAPGTTWVHLVPDKKGEIKGALTFR